MKSAGKLSEPDEVDLGRQRAGSSSLSSARTAPSDEACKMATPVAPALLIDFEVIPLCKDRRVFQAPGQVPNPHFPRLRPEAPEASSEPHFLH